MKRGFVINVVRLTELYHHRGWSQQDLAEKSGLDVRTIAKVKRGGSCDASTLQRIASALEVAPGELVVLPGAPVQKLRTEIDASSYVAESTCLIKHVWKIIDLRDPYSHGPVPSGIVSERYRLMKRSENLDSITMPYLTWGDGIECLAKPDSSQWRIVPVEPGDIVHSDKHWELVHPIVDGPAGTEFEIGPVQLRFVNAFHKPAQQWWQIRVAHEIESLMVQILFSKEQRCSAIQGSWALPGQTKFAPLPFNAPFLLSDGTVANWHIPRPSMGAFYKLAWKW